MLTLTSALINEQFGEALDQIVHNVERLSDLFSSEEELRFNRLLGMAKYELAYLRSKELTLQLEAGVPISVLLPTVSMHAVNVTREERLYWLNNYLTNETLPSISSQP